MSENRGAIPAPTINVTPLIDVLLVLLIIFMVAAPLKPHRFMAKLPAIPHNNPRINPRRLYPRRYDPTRSHAQAQQFVGHGNGRRSFTTQLQSSGQCLNNDCRIVHIDGIIMSRLDLSESQRIEKTVFIKAPRSIPLRRSRARSRRPQGNGRRSHRSATRRSEIRPAIFQDSHEQSMQHYASI